MIVIGLCSAPSRAALKRRTLLPSWKYLDSVRAPANIGGSLSATVHRKLFGLKHKGVWNGILYTFMETDCLCV